MEEAFKAVVLRGDFAHQGRLAMPGAVFDCRGVGWGATTASAGWRAGMLNILRCTRQATQQRAPQPKTVSGAEAENWFKRITEG